MRCLIDHCALLLDGLEKQLLVHECPPLLPQGASRLTMLPERDRRSSRIGMPDRPERTIRSMQEHARRSRGS